ncbi:MAG: glutathione-regulated potassium-efflux system protein KefC [Methylibium sp.]|uniref:glutathione-regulated potassium-efflux system protein KefC n=1 Tax=Methylibium sp. TaxID=2067992 RepID=UPI0017E1494B|nr:glutathione-regulated potassium-efflux system protein KefC [Methylibium sp.]MBA3596253.1 glutathione-regulated potassium-efflux system protein KefC [Methylibium sp.]
MNWLGNSLVFLAAAVLAVPLARALGLGSIVGYLIAGVVIGPHVLQLVGDAETVLRFAEFGVVLMLFLVGLDLEPRRLWSLRAPIFGWGGAQVLGCTALLGAAAWALGVSPATALVVGFGLAMSSTAISLVVLGERNMLPTTSGQSVISISLFQDIMSIPFLAVLPLLAAQQAPAGGGGKQALLVLGAIVAVVLGGRLLLRPALRGIANTRSTEIFTAAALLLVVALASLMDALGLSMALGAFLGGVLLADSEYRRELETDLEPFKGLFMGLFFIAVGMSVDFGVVLARWPLVFGVVLGFLLVKVAVMLVIARAMPVPLAERPVFVLMLAQGGEFGFVVFQAATQAGAIEPALASVMVAAVALSMLLSPLLVGPIDRYAGGRLAARGKPPTPDGLAEPQDAPIIIAGFGRYGQIVGRLLYANGLKATVLEHDAEQIDFLRRFDFTVYYGDATRLDLLRTAGAASAKVLVLAIDDTEQSLKVADLAREHFPDLTVVARARNVQHWYQLRDRGVAHIERETLDASLMSARSVLELLGWQPHRARTLAMRFRRHNIDQLEAMWPHRKDQARLVSMARAGRQQLEELFAQDRANREERRREGWGE